MSDKLKTNELANVMKSNRARARERERKTRDC